MNCTPKRVRLPKWANEAHKTVNSEWIVQSFWKSTTVALKASGMLPINFLYETVCLASLFYRAWFLEIALRPRDGLAIKYYLNYWMGLNQHIKYLKKNYVMRSWYQYSQLNPISKQKSGVSIFFVLRFVYYEIGETAFFSITFCWIIHQTYTYSF